VSRTSVAAHAPGGAGATRTQRRNSVGALLPPVTRATKLINGEAPGTALGGSVKNSLGFRVTQMHPTAVRIAATPTTKPPVPGINGTSLHPNVSGIGGPAKEQSAIAGSTYRHR
jgi:hypothetical protein